jgi:hypothetical protein
MPIKPENAAKYPGGSIKSPEWLAIREQVRLRAHDLCEECGVVNGAYGYRDETGAFHMVDQSAGDLNKGLFLRIVCTVAHVDNALVDHSLDNLRFWCQRCHLNHDRAMRKAAADA